MWYVIYVNSGQEENVINICNRVVSKETYNRLFIPRYICSRKYEGSWHDEALILFPGYVFVDTDDVEAFKMQLRQVDRLTRIIGDGKVSVPVSPREQRYLTDMMNEDDVIQISKGYLIGDKIEIMSGPLKPYPAIITRVDRHKRIAEIDVKLFGISTKARVGLEIIKKI